VFDELGDGAADAEKTGFGTIIERGVAAAEGLPSSLVYAGFSLGVLPAQKLIQPVLARSARCCSDSSSGYYNVEAPPSW
jgi:hypothetical protein